MVAKQLSTEGCIRRRKPDPDNIAKMLDALNRVVWVDDSQIVGLDACQKRYSDRPRIEIYVLGV